MTNGDDRHAAAVAAVREMTDAQAVTVARCMRELQSDGKNTVWHFNDCRCCVAVHEVEASAGYVINRQGEAFWEEHAHA